MMMSIAKHHDQIPDMINSVSVVSGAAVEGYGEDSHAYGFDAQFGYTAVFDGCGTVGSAIYPRFSGQTGAYLASRIAATAAVDWFAQIDFEHGLSVSEMSASYRSIFDDYVTQFDELAEDHQQDDIRFPCSGLLCGFDFRNPNALGCSLVWAGDCRAYILDKKGLAVLTRDDVKHDGELAVKDETELSNYLQCGKYRLNQRELTCDLPAIFLNATSGCYRVFPKPAELEFMVLFTLVRSKSVSQWENSMKTFLQTATNDDFTLAVTAVGFRDFDAMREDFTARLNTLRDTVIDPLKQEDLDEQTAHDILEAYYKEYQRYFG